MNTTANTADTTNINANAKINTAIRKLQPKDVYPGNETICEAVRLLRENEAIVIPTETVYGLAANALSSRGVACIYAAKNRPADNPLIVHALSREMAEALVDFAAMTPEQNKTFQVLYNEFCPGPITFILPKHPELVSLALSTQDTVALRFPRNEIFREIIRQCGFPLAAPSANISGRPSGTNALHIFEDMNGRVPLIIDAGDSLLGLESTIVAIQASAPTILRKGAISQEMLERVLCCSVPFQENLEKTTPGAKYIHYAPTKHLVLLALPFEDALNRVDEHIKAINKEHASENTKIGLLSTEDLFCRLDPALKHRVVFFSTAQTHDSYDTVAAHLFSGIRTLDTLNVEYILATGVDEAHCGAAIMDRLRRAASEIEEEHPSKHY